MARGRRWWYRSSPLWGALGGFLYAAYLHLFGGFPRAGRGGLFRAFARGVGLPALFEVHPLVGYAVLVALGALAGWVARRFEDRYVYTE